MCLFGLGFDIEKYFMRDDVQRILKQITGFNLEKIFQERKITDLKPPEYKLLTTKQLEEVLRLLFIRYIRILERLLLCILVLYYMPQICNICSLFCMKCSIKKHGRDAAAKVDRKQKEKKQNTCRELQDY